MTFRRTVLFSATASLLGSLLHLPASAQQVIKLTITAVHPPVFLWVKLTDEVFILEVDKRLPSAGDEDKLARRGAEGWHAPLI